VRRESELHFRLRTLRAEAKLTQKQVADFLKVDVSTYAHYEKGDRTPDAAKLSALANLYKLDDEMLGSQFPIETYVFYEKKDIENLKHVLEKCEWRRGDYQYNRDQFDMLKEAVSPLLQARNAALSIPEVNISDLPVGTDIIKVKLDRTGEALIERYLEESNKYFEMM